MAELTVQIVLSALQTTGLLIGIFYYMMTLNNQRKAQEISLQSQQLALDTRQAQLFMQMFSKQTSKDAFEYQRVLGDHQYSTHEEWEELMENDMEFNEAWQYFAWLWESIGALLREEYVDIRLLALYNTSGTIDAWEYNKNIIYGNRFKYNNPRSWCEWEYCYTTLMKFIEENPEFAYTP